MADSPLLLLAAVVLGLGLAACIDDGTTVAGDRVLTLELPITLDRLIDAVGGAGEQGHACEFTVLDQDGESLPWALVRLDWGGARRLSLQSDGEGRLTLGLFDLLDPAGVTISVDAKPHGQDLLSDPYEECTQRLPRAHVALRVVER